MKQSVIVIGSLLLLFGIATVVFLKIQREYFSKYSETGFEDSYNGKIVDIEKSRGFVFVTFEDGSKYSIIDSKNNLYNPSHFYSMVDKGDSLVKIAESDSIVVLRNDKKYIFRMGISIN